MTDESLATDLADTVIGHSPCIQQLRNTIVQLAGCDVNVLLEGESGTGKDLVAQTIHQLSPRCQRGFTAVNCAAIHETLLESELFGHEDGAFTGARGETLGFFRATDGGTILLDEVGDMSPALQSTLLRVLEERVVVPVGGTRRIPINVRVISASNRDLAAAVRDKTFRLDLFYRLNTVSLSIAPLRRRRIDIAPLVDHWVATVATTLNLPAKTLSPQALEVLSGYDWPGNVRQLANVIQRAYVLGVTDTIVVDDLPAALIDGDAAPGRFPTLKEIIAQHVDEAMQLSAGVRVRASGLLGIDRKSLSRLLRRYDIS